MGGLTKRDKVEALIEGLSAYLDGTSPRITVPRRLIREAVKVLREDYGVQERMDL